MSSSFLGSMSRAVVLVGGVAVAGMSPAAIAHGQESEDHRTDEGVWEPPRNELFMYFAVADPVGGFQDHVGTSPGAGGGGVFRIDGLPNVALRVEANYVIYGSRSYNAPLGPDIPLRGEVRVKTTNSIFSAGLGPQVYLGSGAYRPYVFGTVGMAFFATRTGVRGNDRSEDFLSGTNYLDFDLALAAGGGLSVQLRKERRPLFLDLSASYHYNGPTQYLTGGDRNLERRSGGDWEADPIRSDANLMTYRVALKWAVR